jgi:hypothetical protein
LLLLALKSTCLQVNDHADPCRHRRHHHVCSSTHACLHVTDNWHADPRRHQRHHHVRSSTHACLHVTDSRRPLARRSTPPPTPPPCPLIHTCLPACHRLTSTTGTPMHAATVSTYPLIRTHSLHCSQPPTTLLGQNWGKAESIGSLRPPVLTKPAANPLQHSRSLHTRYGAHGTPYSLPLP